jgi:hypothetical protein
MRVIGATAHTCLEHAGKTWLIKSMADRKKGWSTFFPDF